MLNLCFFHYSLALYTIYPTNIAWEFIVGWNNFLSSKIHETSGWLGFNVLCSAAVEPRLSRLQVCVVCVTDATVLAYLIQPGSANFTSVSCSFLLHGGEEFHEFASNAKPISGQVWKTRANVIRSLVYFIPEGRRLNLTD